MAVPLLALIASGWGYANARRRPGIRRVEVPIAGLPPALQGCRIVQISDLHVGMTIKRPFVEAVVEAVNALDADVIVLTGDLVDGGVAQLREHIAPLASLRARGGVLAVTGNHEYYSGAQAWIDELRRLGARVLMNEHVVLSRGDAAWVVAGVPDFGAHRFDPTHRADPVLALARGACRSAAHPAGPPAARGAGGRARRRRPPAVGPHARGPVHALELVREAAAALHRGVASTRPDVGVRESRHRLLGPAQAARGAVRNLAAGARCSLTAASVEGHSGMRLLHPSLSRGGPL